MGKNITFLLFAIALVGCSSGGTYSSYSPTKVTVKAETPPIKVQTRSAPPAWFATATDDAFFFVIKNAEKSGSKKLAETRNLLISEILLANTIQKDFMTSSDQEAVVKSIRASSSIEDIKKYMNNPYVESIVPGYTVEHSETQPYDTGFISYISIKRIKNWIKPVPTIYNHLFELSKKTLNLWTGCLTLN